MRSISSLALLLAGCGIDEDNFEERFAQGICSTAERCHPDEFYETYEDLEGCLEATVPLVEDVQDVESPCAIDYELATECYRETMALSCEEVDDGYQPEACEGYVVCGYPE